ncbi:MAG: glucose-6-phosphate isomerase, partial [Candidatus Sericytochromatia bacterium]
MPKQSIRLAYDDMMAEFIGAEHGLSEASLDQLAPRMQEVHSAIWSRTGTGADYLGFLDLPWQEEALDAIQASADQLAESTDLHVVLGIGGSYLGARALFGALCHPYHNELPRARRNNRPRLYFEGNNVDGDALAALIDLLPKNRPESLAERWSINVISKSGGTLETAVAFRLMRQLAERQYGHDASRYIVATTDASRGQLFELAKAQGYHRFVVPDDVGGRYSVLTPVGLLPAAIAGIDIHALMAGA